MKKFVTITILIAVICTVAIGANAVGINMKRQRIIETYDLDVYVELLSIGIGEATLHVGETFDVTSWYYDGESAGIEIYRHAPIDDETILWYAYGTTNPIAEEFCNELIKQIDFCEEVMQRHGWE